MKLYLAYGANTNLEKMASRCPEAQYICNITLYHHRLVFRRVADVVAQKGSKCVCALWVISPKDEEALDRFEGFPNTYVKRYISIYVKGKKHRVMFYVMRARNKYEAEPPQAYEETLRKGYEQCGMPIEQLDKAIRRAKAWVASHASVTLPADKSSWTPTTASSVVVPEGEENEAAEDFMRSYYEQNAPKEDHNA